MRPVAASTRLRNLLFSLLTLAATLLAITSPAAASPASTSVGAPPAIAAADVGPDHPASPETRRATRHTYDDTAVATGVAAKSAAGAAKITFGHGARHLAGTGLDDAAVNAAIKAQVEQSIATASATGSFWGRVAVNGQIIEYRAYPLKDGTINVGTYYVPK